MKKTLFILIALPLLLASCTNKHQETPVSTMKGVFHTVMPDAAETIELLAGKSKTFDVRVVADAVSDVYLSMSFKVDPDAVSTYNSKNGTSYPMLPSSAFEFTKNEVMVPKYNKSSTTAKVRITAKGLEDDVVYLLPVSIDKVTGTDNWELAADPCAYIRVMQVNTGPEGGDGSPEYPYILATAEDMSKMSDKLSAEEKMYFRMTADIDMSGISWIPLNFSSPYANEIDFDGAGHTISNFYCEYPEYPSFFGVLNGYCHDVTFVNAKVVVKSAARTGILAGYCGTGDIHGEAERVHIQGELDHTASTKYGAGGFFGYLANGAVRACSADVIVTSKLNNVGGIFGYCGKSAEVRDCWTSGVITGAQRVGGIGGGTDGKEADLPEGIVISNCYSTASVRGSFALGGIGGFFNMANTTSGSPKELNPGNHVEYCIAWNADITANWNQEAGSGTITPADVSHYSNGAIIGYTAVHNFLIGCFRNPAMKYDENIFFDYTDAFSLYDQENSSPTSPLMIKEVSGSNHNFPYHGKAGADGITLSRLAQDLGWSDSVWDFSGERPLIRPDASYVPVVDINGDGQLGDYDENKLN